MWNAQMHVRPWELFVVVWLIFSAAARAAETAALENGVPAGNLAGATGSEKFFRITVPVSQARLEVRIFGGSV